MRRQIGHYISMGWPLGTIQTKLYLPADFYVWTPYDLPTPEDVRHVYEELTVPKAPYKGQPPDPADKRPHALVLIADRYHEPGHILAGLKPLFQATGVIPHYTVDVRAITAENLAKVKLLVIQRDGMLWPDGYERDKKYQIWMTPEQEKAVVDFVDGGRAFLNLHNSMGLYPKDGPYLNLVGGRYIGHGPLERFRTVVVDKTHPITQGVSDFFTADEQHTPPADRNKVHIFLENRNDDDKVTAAAGWAYEPGKGRLVHVAGGHTLESFLEPNYQRVLRNSINWLLAGGQR